MKSLKEEKSKILNFWELEEQDQEKLINEIRQYSELKTSEELNKEIRENFDQVNFSGISVIYEALSKNPKKWAVFFKEEYYRAFETAKKVNNPFEVLESLEEISFVNKEELITKNDIIELLNDNLTHNNDTIRFKSIWYLGDWISEDNTNKYNYSIQKIIRLLDDKNWRVRYIAKVTLEELKRLPNGFKFGLIDQLRVKILNPFNMK